MMHGPICITYFMFSNLFFIHPKNCAVYEIMWKHGTAGQAASYVIWRIRFACWITKSADTQSEYVTCLLFPGSGACTDAPHCYVCTFIVSFVKLRYIFVFIALKVIVSMKCL